MSSINDDYLNSIAFDNTGIHPAANEKITRIDGGEQQVIVAARIRPLTEEEIIQGSTITSHKIADDNHIVLIDPLDDPDDILRVNRSRERQFVFDMVFDAKSTQQDVYNKTTKVLLPNVLNGYNATVFAYGATGAGKTYTMLGTPEEPGIMFRTLHDLFIEITKTSSDLLYQVSMSYLEIYNELIRDLLCPSAGFLELREDAKGGVQIAGISEKVAETPQEVMHLLTKGNKERTQEPTKANKTSSRSHAVLQVNIKQRDKVRKHTQEIRLGKLYMIDLAGSERAAQTQNTGKRMVEGAHINRSLLALGNCINALSEKGSTKYVNYRDSKLTRILKDSLSGNSKTVMIAHISPASIHFEESRNTLVYADRAKYIRTKLRRNVVDVSYHISQYQQIIQELAQEIANLKEQRTDLESKISHLYTKNSITKVDDKLKLEDSIKIRESLIQSFKDLVKLRKDLLDLDSGMMDIKIEADRYVKLIRSSEENDAYDKKNETVIANAKEELKVIKVELDNLESKRKETFNEYEQIQQKSQKLKEMAYKKLNSHEHRDIIKLLCNNFEFELKNLENQSDIFLRDFQIREKDMVVLRLEQHRSLCDTLIDHQRQLIKQNNLATNKDLDELYFLYSRDIKDGYLMKDISDIVNLNIAPQKSLPQMNKSLIKINEESSILNDASLIMNDEKINDSLFPSPWAKRNLINAFDRSNSDNKVFYKTNKYFANDSINKNLKRDSKRETLKNKNGTANNGHNSIPHFSFNKISKDSKNNLSMLSTGTNDSNIEILLESNGHKLPEPLYLENEKASQSKPLKKHTQGIAAVAAQKKASQHHRDLMMEEFAKTEESVLAESPREKNEQKYSILSNVNQPIHAVDKYNEFKLNILTDGSNKNRKQVKIQENNVMKVSTSNGSDTMKKNEDENADDANNETNVEYKFKLKKTPKRSKSNIPKQIEKNDSNSNLKMKNSPSIHSNWKTNNIFSAAVKQ